MIDKNILNIIYDYHKSICLHEIHKKIKTLDILLINACRRNYPGYIDNFGYRKRPNLCWSLNKKPIILIIYSTGWIEDGFINETEFFKEFYYAKIPRKI